MDTVGITDGTSVGDKEGTSLDARLVPFDKISINSCDSSGSNFSA